MKKYSEKLKKRIKAGLKIMRESSGGKYEIVRDIHRMDPSQVENGKTFPTLNTIMNYCELFDRCPGWLLLLSCEVDRGKISEFEFLRIIKNWHDLVEIADWKMEEFIKMVKTRECLRTDCEKYTE